MADHVRGPAPRPHREYPQIAAALAAPDPTPAAPMDGWFEDHLEAFERQLDEGLATDDACEGYAVKKRALWAAVVAYGDRRAEEARAELIERMEDPLDPLCLRCYLAECKSAQSSPAPEGVELTPLYHTLMNDMIEEAPDA